MLVKWIIGDVAVIGIDDRLDRRHTLTLWKIDLLLAIRTIDIKLKWVLKCAVVRVDKIALWCEFDPTGRIAFDRVHAEQFHRDLDAIRIFPTGFGNCNLGLS